MAERTFLDCQKHENTEDKREEKGGDPIQDQDGRRLGVLDVMGEDQHKGKFHRPDSRDIGQRV